MHVCMYSYAVPPISTSLIDSRFDVRAVYVYMCVEMGACVYMHVCMCVCMYVCMYAVRALG